MFEKFDDKSIKTIMLAQEEARRLSHNFVGTEQILLGIIAEGTNLASKALRGLGVSLKNARLEVHKIIGSGSDNVGKEVPFTPRAKKLLDNSVKVGLILKHKEVRPEHLLLGLIIQDEGVGIKVLENLGVERSPVARQVFSVLASQGDKSAVEWFSKIAAQVEPGIVETDSEQYVESPKKIIDTDILLTTLVERQDRHISNLLSVLKEQAEVQKVMAGTSKYDMRGSNFQGGFAERNMGNMVENQYNSYAEKQDLAEAAREIQELLMQLENTNPNTTNNQQKIIVNKAISEIEKNPTLKARVLNVIKSGGTETFKEAVNHPLVNILVSMINGWIEAE
jgi:ATP-dependent Clp protease ATP-binding subunit ClpA